MKVGIWQVGKLLWGMVDFGTCTEGRGSEKGEIAQWPQ
jgi:hypothetical protein